MSAHPEGEAVEAGSADPLDEILKFAEDEEQDDPADDDGGEDPEDELEDDESEGDDPEEEEEGDEPDEPAITPPVSLNKEQKAAFAQLPPDLQKVWAESEAQRNRDVQIKTTEAAEAKRNAATEAQGELAQIRRQYAQELEVYAQAFVPIRPDPALIAEDPYAYAQQVQYAEQQQAQYDQIMQQVAAARHQAGQFDQQAHQATLQSEHKKLVDAWPEWGDPAKRAELAQSVTAIGSELGYTPEVLAQAGASDILALKKVAELKAAADKWHDFQARKMANVRAAKDLPKVARPGNAQSRNPSKAAKAGAAWQRAKVSKSGDDFADFLEATGVTL